MPVISQNLTLPGNVQTGGTIQASDVATLYQAMNAFNIPGTIGVFQQGFVDNTRYTSTAGGSIDWAFTTASNKAIIFMAPFSWSGTTAGANVLLAPRVSAVQASTSYLSFTGSSGNGMVVGFVGPISTDTLRSGFVVEMNDRTPGTLDASAFTVTQSTADRTSMGFGSSSTGSFTIVWNGVRFWTEG